MRIVLILSLLLLAGGARAETFELRGATMGTTYHIKFVAEPASVGLEQLHAEVEEILAGIDRQMSTYRNDSELSRFNQSKTGNWFTVSRPMAEVIAAAQEISKKTGGAMDVTVGPLVRLWHFGPTTTTKGDAKPEFAPPTTDSLAAARKVVGYEQLYVRLDPPELRKEVDDVEVDLSSIAPGYAIDELLELLVARGIANAMVEIGGEVRATGVRQDGKPWRGAIERPTDGGRMMQAAVPLTDAAIATAGDYRKFFEYGGQRYSHIIDPSTGKPVEHSLASVTVVADTCIEADGWDTPLLVLGPKKGFECAEKNSIAAMFISRGRRGPEVRETSAWKSRFKQ
jgi:thiamine biosynthesis lipoprotein